MSVFQGQANERVVYLVNGGTPVTGLVDTDVTLRFRKKGEDFQNKALTSTNFKELEVGLYSIDFEGNELDTLGPLTFRINGAGIDQYVETFDVDPIYLGALVPPGICIISGNIIDLGGDPVWNAIISFRTVDLPSIVGSSMVAGTFVKTITDVSGNFYVSLIRGATVLVEIEKTAVKYQFGVPDQETANLVDLLPAI